MFRLSFCIQNGLLTLWLRVHNLGLLTPSLVFDVTKKLFNSQCPLTLSAKRILLSPQRKFLLRSSVFDLTWEESTFFELFAVMGSILSFDFLIRNFVAFVSLNSFWVKLLAKVTVWKVSWSTSVQCVCTNRIVKAEKDWVVLLLIKLWQHHKVVVLFEISESLIFLCLLLEWFGELVINNKHTVLYFHPRISLTKWCKHMI